MDERRYWIKYVEQAGGVRAVAEKLDTPYSTIASITNGQRGIGRRLAARFAERDSLLDVNRLVWVRPERKAA